MRRQQATAYSRNLRLNTFLARVGGCVRRYSNIGRGQSPLSHFASVKGGRTPFFAIAVRSLLLCSRLAPRGSLRKPASRSEATTLRRLAERGDYLKSTRGARRLH